MKKLLFLATLIFSIGCNASKLNPSIFLISNLPYSWIGTAFQLQTKRGPVVITNKHVCDTNILMVANFETKRTVKLLVVKAVSQKYDLCVLSAVANIPTLNLAEDYSKGDEVTVDGYPLAVRTLTRGRVVKGLLYDTDGEPNVVIGFSGLVNNGNSGSPVMDSQGKVIGVLNSKIGQPSEPGPGFFVPLEALKDFLDTLGYN